MNRAVMMFAFAQSLVGCAPTVAVLIHQPPRAAGTREVELSNPETFAYALSADARDGFSEVRAVVSDICAVRVQQLQQRRAYEPLVLMSAQVALADAVGIGLVGASYGDGEGAGPRAASIAAAVAGADLALGAATYGLMHRKTVRSTAFNTKVCSDARSVGAHRASVGIRFDGGEWTDLGALRSNADGVFPLPIEDIGRMTLARTAPNEPISATLRFSWPEEVARVPKPHIDTTPADSLLVVPDAWKAWQCAALTAPEVAIPDPAASKWLAIAQVHDASCPAGAAVARSKACAFVPDAIAEIQRARTLVSLQVISARFEPNVLYGACETDQQRMLEQTLREAYGSLAAAESPTHVQLSALDAMSASALAAGTAVVNDREVAWAGLLERASAQKASLAEPLRAWSEGLRGPLSEDSDAGKAWRSAMKAIGTSTAAQDPRPVQKALTARAPWLGNAFVQAWVGSAVAAAGAGEWSTLRTVEGVLADAALLESIKLTDADRSRLSKQALDMRKTQLARGCAAPDGSASGHDTRAECLKWMWQEMHKRHDRDAPPVAGVMEKVMDAVVSAESKRDAAQAREYAELREIGRALRDSGVFGCDSKKAMCNENCKFAMNIPGDPFAGMRCYADCMDENGCRP